uniref:Uncharacterized protein n=1 Tax=Glossina palpalis gambiensis TaxID=67801 RepID=A0A1B0AWB8_9MUSC
MYRDISEEMQNIKTRQNTTQHKTEGRSILNAFVISLNELMPGISLSVYSGPHIARDIGPTSGSHASDSNAKQFNRTPDIGIRMVRICFAALYTYIYIKGLLLLRLGDPQHMHTGTQAIIELFLLTIMCSRYSVLEED